ncbi:MAG: GNAT family N-acetyltransferase [Saprospiraceae bacterium]
MNLLTTIRKANVDDLEYLLDLVKELARFENAPEAVTANLQDYRENFEQGVFEALVATNNVGKIVGTAIFYVCWSTWKGRMLYLEDFVVLEDERGKGIGKILFEAVVEEARHQKCALMKWQVLDWNIPAINFYLKNNAIIEKEWWNGKIVF